MFRLLVTLTFLAVTSSVYGNVLEANFCNKAGFFPLVDNTAEFYGCYHNNAGGLSIQYLRCPKGTVFSGSEGYCISKIENIVAKDSTGGDIENPTIPTDPTKLDDTTTTEVPETTKPTEAPATTTTTDEPATTTTPEVPETTTDSSETTTTTEEPETTEDPVTTTDEPETTTTESGETTTAQPFECITLGIFPQDSSCTDFVVCYKSGETYKQASKKCPSGQNFNPEGFCDVNYECTVYPDTLVDEVEEELECLVEGSFADRKDCSRYYTCSWSHKHHAFEFKPQQCPEGQVFHLLSGQCGRKGILTCLGRSKVPKFGGRFNVLG